MKATEHIDFKELKEVVKALNESSVSEDKIRVVGVGKDKVLAGFIQVIEAAIDQGKEDSVPDAAVDFYNDLFADEQEEVEVGEEIIQGQQEEMVGEAGEGQQIPPESGEPLPPIKTKPKRLPPGAHREVNSLGHTVGSQAAQLDDLLAGGETVEEMAKKIGSNVSRVRNHIYHLQKIKGLTIKQDKETRKYQVVG